MLAVDYSGLSQRLDEYCDRAVDDMETVVVSREDERSLVLMSLASYNNMMENLFIRSDRKNYQHIVEGIYQIETGKSLRKTHEEMRRLLDE